jgi:predicted Zn-dependent protease
LAIASVLPLAAGIALVVGGALRPQPNLDEVCALAEAHRFDQAEARGAAYLRQFPDDPQALLVMAELALSRPAPEPQRALERLQRVRTGTPALAAWVLVNQGNAYWLLSRFDRSEVCWKEARERDPTVHEAGRRLLDLYTLQGRPAEARRLALGQFDREPDPRERLRLLLRLGRLDVDPLDPWLIINRFEPAIRRQAADLPTTLACGLALTSVSRSQDGLPLLRQAVQRHPADPAAWDALMTGLELARQDAELVEIFHRLPEDLRTDPRFAKHQGRLDQAAGRWSQAARAYRRAWDLEPEHTVGYRLRRALEFAGQPAEARCFDQLFLDYRAAYQQVRVLVDQAHAALGDGQPLPPELAPRMADLRERMGRPDEANAWRRLVSRSATTDPHSSPTRRASHRPFAVP